MPKLRRVRSDLDREAVRDLNSDLFDDSINLDRGAWWVGWSDGCPVSFGGARSHRHGRDWGCYLLRAGVLPAHRHQGLQARHIWARLRWASEKRMPYAWAYTAPSNAASMRTLIRCGFRPWSPGAWDGRQPGTWVYWRRDMVTT